ncbi:MAG TPA: hypothetical protein VJ904_00605 [Tichowtungia sp.]|nr:hypothetical protein [Tichowtungia sp.]
MAPKEQAGASQALSIVESHLYVGFDAGVISSEEFERLKKATEATGRKISGFISYLRKAEQN